MISVHVIDDFKVTQIQVRIINAKRTQKRKKFLATHATRAKRE